MDHSTDIPLSKDEFAPDMIEGATIYGPDEKEIGTVSQLLVGGRAVIDVGGFLGIGVKHVAIPVSELTFTRGADGEVHGLSGWTKQQFKELPDYED